MFGTDRQRHRGLNYAEIADWSVERDPEIEPSAGNTNVNRLDICPGPSVLDGRNKPDRDSGQEMSRPPKNRSTGSAHSPVRRSRSHTRPYLPLPSDVPTNPDSPVSEPAAELLHEFVHPHHLRENLLGTEEEPDEAGGDALAIAKELEEMQGRVWWRRPSALWYVLHMFASAQPTYT
jgi:hypothetical protein